MLNDKSEDIETLLDAIREIHGPHSIEPYGDFDDPLSAGFRIRGIPATFSIVIGDRVPERHYSVQIESYPPQDMDYFFYSPSISLWDLLEQIRGMTGPKDKWPRMEP